MKNANFLFIGRDIERQREIARDALQVVRDVNQILESDESSKKLDKDMRAALESIRKVNLKIARDLADNANNTSINVENVVGAVVSANGW